VRRKEMDDALAWRLRLVVRRRLKALQAEREGLEVVDGCRTAHDHVLAAIPGALRKLTDAVAEINDVVSSAGVHLILEPIDEVLSLEASFWVSAWPQFEPPAELHFNVNHDGRMTALLVIGQDSTALSARDVRDADRPFFLDALVRLLEA
jgi:hypothetical protein